MTRRDGGAQKALWGRQTPIPPPPAARAAVNDLDLVGTVIRHANEPGYVLIGPAERVYVRVPTNKGAVEPVPTYEAATVAQLLDSGHLKIGGNHTVHYGRHEGSARSVLVTTRARSMLARWAALKPIA